MRERARGLAARGWRRRAGGGAWRRGGEARGAAPAEAASREESAEHVPCDAALRGGLWRLAFSLQHPLHRAPVCAYAPGLMGGHRLALLRGLQRRRAPRPSPTSAWRRVRGPVASPVDAGGLGLQSTGTGTGRRAAGPAVATGACRCGAGGGAPARGGGCRRLGHASRADEELGSERTVRWRQAAPSLRRA